MLGQLLMAERHQRRWQAYLADVGYGAVMALTGGRAPLPTWAQASRPQPPDKRTARQITEDLLAALDTKRGESR